MENLERVAELANSYLGWLTYAAIEWYFGISCIVLALISYVYFKEIKSRNSLLSFVKFCFPKSIYLHRSTRIDLLYLLSFPIAASVIFSPALGFSTAALTYQGMQRILVGVWGEVGGAAPMTELTGLLWVAAFTVASALAADLGFYLHHYALHKIPFLWEFHKVHHSAEVLTPLTDYRSHPLELLTYGSAKGVGLGAIQAVFNFALGNTISVGTILGLNAAFFIYYLLAYPLRHSHIWISYGPLLNHVFISPAQHQIHHSVERRHWDKNLGGMFAIWDWIFGTLYVPREREHFHVGLHNAQSDEYSSVWNLYVLPFRRNMRTAAGSVVVTALCLTLAFYALRNGLGQLRFLFAV